MLNTGGTVQNTNVDVDVDVDVDDDDDYHNLMY